MFFKFKFTIYNFLKLSVVLADSNEAQLLLSNLKQIVEKQNDQISQLHNKVVKLETVNEMLVDTNIEILGKNQMVEKAFRVKGIK